MTSALPAASQDPIARRIDGCDWAEVASSLDDQGSAVIDRLLTPSECACLIEMRRRYESEIAAGRRPDAEAIRRIGGEVDAWLGRPA